MNQYKMSFLIELLLYTIGCFLLSNIPFSEAGDCVQMCQGGKCTQLCGRRKRETEMQISDMHARGLISVERVGPYRREKRGDCVQMCQNGTCTQLCASGGRKKRSCLQMTGGLSKFSGAADCVHFSHIDSGSGSAESSNTSEESPQPTRPPPKHRHGQQSELPQRNVHWTQGTGGQKLCWHGRCYNQKKDEES